MTFMRGSLVTERIHVYVTIVILYVQLQPLATKNKLYGNLLEARDSERRTSTYHE
jgi:hypothetical protein